jgi:hypothetical protein
MAGGFRYATALMEAAGAIGRLCGSCRGGDCCPVWCQALHATRQGALNTHHSGFLVCKIGRKWMLRPSPIILAVLGSTRQTRFDRQLFETHQYSSLESKSP